jgi:amidase
MHLKLASIVAGVAALALTVQAQGRSFDLLAAGIDDIQAAVDAGALTYERLVRMYLDRIDAFDRRGPQLRAVIAINPRAIETARTLDAERKQRGRRSRLHGIPIAVKDNIDFGGMPTTGGSAAFIGSYPPRDATVIQKLREAGAIIIAKTNLDELASASRGLSTVGGQTLNPYDLTRSPGGSSAGNAVAIASGFAAIAIGTATGFSVRGPASNTGIVGVVPSRGVISRAGVMPLSFTQDRIGVHARWVDDAATVLQTIRGFDDRDAATEQSLGAPQAPLRPIPDAKGLRVGVLVEMFREGEQFTAFNTVVLAQRAALARAGLTVIDDLSTGSNPITLMPDLRVNSFELRTAFDAYLSARGPTSPVKTFADFVAGGKYLRGGSLERRIQETMQITDLQANADYQQRLKTQASLRAQLVALMEKHQLAALMYPVKSLAAPPIGTSDDGLRDNNISAVTGLPAVVVPAAFHSTGLPVALEFLGAPFSEARLLAVAAAYQRINPVRVTPPSTPSRAADTIRY